MNRERFHNKLAIRLGYERIVNDKRILISAEDSDVPVVTLKVHGNDDIRYKASENPETIKFQTQNELREVIKEIVSVVHQAYIEAVTNRF